MLVKSYVIIKLEELDSKVFSHAETYNLARKRYKLRIKRWKVNRNYKFKCHKLESSIKREVRSVGLHIF